MFNVDFSNKNIKANVVLKIFFQLYKLPGKVKLFLCIGVHHEDH